eukprot:297289-Chlamydomonas_euryale.AAC.1
MLEESSGLTADQRSAFRRRRHAEGEAEPLPPRCCTPKVWQSPSRPAVARLRRDSGLLGRVHAARHAAKSSLPSTCRKDES